jgi:2-polyprenyl-6-hydroxyphenyl methylase/3-demethylubiquinone-9 3-methyltransferase
MTDNYYAQKLNASNLYRVYETRIERVKRYLDAEIDFVRRSLRGDERVLELGAGYGRIMKKLAPFAASITGIDISEDSVAFGREYLADATNCRIETMDAHAIAFDAEFDVVLCLQNALSAMKGDAADTVARCVKSLVPGGTLYCSSYSPKFWEHRLAWFREQADKGLLGAIDDEKTRDGLIVCRDGFVARTFSPGDLESLGRASGYPYRIEEVDDSSVFLVIRKGA